MNVNYPHDIIDDIRSVSKRERHRYVPIPVERVAALKAMLPEERAAWLAEHQSDAARIARAEAKRARKKAARAGGEGKEK